MLGAYLYWLMGIGFLVRHLQQPLNKSNDKTVVPLVTTACAKTSPA